MIAITTIPYSRMRTSGARRSASGNPTRAREPSTAPKGELIPPSTTIVSTSTDIWTVNTVGSR